MKILIILLCCMHLYADEMPLLGHNLTPTTYTPPKRTLTIGTYAASYGITDEWSIATSPWMIIFYNMPMINTRITFKLNEVIEKISLDLNYFKTFNYGLDIYRQESIFARLTTLQQLTENYGLYVSLGVQYFLPGSYNTYSIDLRHINYRFNQDPYILSLSTLHEIKYGKNNGFLFEAGLIGLNNDVPYLHLGASAIWYSTWGFLQIGASASTELGRVYYYGGIHPIVHPEVQLQFFM